MKKLQRQAAKKGEMVENVKQRALRAAQELQTHQPESST